MLLPSPFRAFRRAFVASSGVLSVCSAKWSPLGLMDVALDTIIVRIVVYRRESEKGAPLVLQCRKTERIPCYEEVTSVALASWRAIMSKRDATSRSEKTFLWMSDCDTIW